MERSTGVVAYCFIQHRRCGDYHRRRRLDYVPEPGRSVLDRLDQKRHWAALRAFSRSSTKRPAMRSRIPPTEPCGKASSSAWRTTRCSSPRDGTERPIDDSAAPIRNENGEVAGVVLVFRDVTERRRQERALRDCLTYGENIVATLREPFLVLDKALAGQIGQPGFLRDFHVSPKETEDRLVYELGNGQWDIPKLRTLLEEVLPEQPLLP